MINEIIIIQVGFLIKSTKKDDEDLGVFVGRSRKNKIKIS